MFRKVFSISPSSAAIFSSTFINFSACSCVIYYPLNFSPNPLVGLPIMQSINPMLDPMFLAKIAIVYPPSVEQQRESKVQVNSNGIKITQ